MSPNFSNLSHDRRVGQAQPHSVERKGDVTQRGQTIDHAPRLYRFSLGIFSAMAPARLAAASIPSAAAQITRHGDSQAPAFAAGSLMLQGIATMSPETLHKPPTQPAPIAAVERGFEAGGEGVETSAWC